MSDLSIIPDNIRAAEAVHFAAQMERLKVFDVADRLLELFVAGQLPIGQAQNGEAIRRFWMEASNRISQDERQMLYSRVLGTPGGGTGITPNDGFEALWLRFVSSVVAFERQLESETSAGSEPVDQQTLRQTARDLAVHLSRQDENVKPLARAIAAQRHDLIRLLGDPEIHRAYGVRDMWQLIDRVSEVELGGSRVNRHRIAMAESGAAILAWLSSRAATLGEDDRDMLDAAAIRSRLKSNTPSAPTDYDLADAAELWLAASNSADAPFDDPARLPDSSHMREDVALVLARARQFAHLSAAMQSRLTRDTARVADYLTRFITAVDFPAFVAGLIKGVFDANVDASIRQMEAYGDLISSVAAALDEFTDENISDTQAREYLCRQYPPICAPSDRAGGPTPPGDELAVGNWARLANSRQQLLASMVLMGVARISESTR